MEDEMKFKSHRTLGIPKKLRKSLVWFVRSVKSHKINEGKKKFDMDTIISNNYSCGTAACIGGWCAIKALGLKPNKKGQFLKHEGKITDLFNQWSVNDNIRYLFNADGYPLYRVDVDIACKATEEYL